MSWVLGSLCSVGLSDESLCFVEWLEDLCVNVACLVVMDFLYFLNTSFWSSFVIVRPRKFILLSTSYSDLNVVLLWVFVEVGKLFAFFRHPLYRSSHKISSTHQHICAYLLPVSYTHLKTQKSSRSINNHWSREL